MSTMIHNTLANIAFTPLPSGAVYGTVASTSTVAWTARLPPAPNIRLFKFTRRLDLLQRPVPWHGESQQSWSLRFATYGRLLILKHCRRQRQLKALEAAPRLRRLVNGECYEEYESPRRISCTKRRRQVCDGRSWSCGVRGPRPDFVKKCKTRVLTQEERELYITLDIFPDEEEYEKHIRESMEIVDRLVARARCYVPMDTREDKNLMPFFGLDVNTAKATDNRTALPASVCLSNSIGPGTSADVSSSVHVPDVIEDREVYEARPICPPVPVTGSLGSASACTVSSRTSKRLSLLKRLLPYGRGTRKGRTSCKPTGDSHELSACLLSRCRQDRKLTLNGHHSPAAIIAKTRRRRFRLARGRLRLHFKAVAGATYPSFHFTDLKVGPAETEPVRTPQSVPQFSQWCNEDSYGVERTVKKGKHRSGLPDDGEKSKTRRTVREALKPKSMRENVQDEETPEAAATAETLRSCYVLPEEPVSLPATPVLGLTSPAMADNLDTFAPEVVEEEALDLSASSRTDDDVVLEPVSPPATPVLALSSPAMADTIAQEVVEEDLSASGRTEDDVVLEPVSLPATPVLAPSSPVMADTLAHEAVEEDAMDLFTSGRTEDDVALDAVAMDDLASNADESAAPPKSPPPVKLTVKLPWRRVIKRIQEKKLEEEDLVASLCSFSLDSSAPSGHGDELPDSAGPTRSKRSRQHRRGLLGDASRSSTRHLVSQGRQGRLQLRPEDAPYSSKPADSAVSKPTDELMEDVDVADSPGHAVDRQEPKDDPVGETMFADEDDADTDEESAVEDSGAETASEDEGATEESSDEDGDEEADEDEDADDGDHMDDEPGDSPTQLPPPKKLTIRIPPSFDALLKAASKSLESMSVVVPAHLSPRQDHPDGSAPDEAMEDGGR
ncbi:hypothetical protein NEOLEDRAFT_1177287 [Neolentinus lepideus HHB14362 ss-1]|uniref:Uncharacterized protein n=1 Tax=Neolentinus lepideus HHB14362 ss-1 TaxID=1314782 RepID=A0A165TI01_9AGAM|nr:hypothetical protein NEOLEDRAFT_1177287 [Neolentinus lepideus HHB14362 ss-1]